MVGAVQKSQSSATPHKNLKNLTAFPGVQFYSLSLQMSTDLPLQFTGASVLFKKNLPL